MTWLMDFASTWDQWDLGRIALGWIASVCVIYWLYLMWRAGP